jgi:hypothetical protein
MIETEKGQGNPSIPNPAPSGCTYAIAMVILGAVFYAIYEIII